jgi:LAS superfamily LD-carboxypeptidase LdcB
MPDRPPSRRLRAAGIAIALLLSGSLVDSSVDAATTSKNPRADQERVRREKAALAQQLDTLKATAKELEDALRVIDDNLRQEEAALEAARKVVADEQRAAETLRAQQVQATERLAALDRLLVQSAVDAYMRPEREGDLFSMSSKDINEALRKQALFDLTNTTNRDAADQVKAARAELKRLEDERNAALGRAQAAQTEVEKRVGLVDAARAEQARIVAAADEKVDHALGEMKTLESLDRQLAAQIEAEARRLAAEAEARRRAATVGRTLPTLPSSGEIVTVGGFQVHQSIANNMRNLLAAAGAAGIELSGTGFRDSSGQIALRRANCGTSDYAIFQMDPFSCRPPTARPGSSNHERGLAIDFTSDGRVLSRGSRAFVWLAGNAGRFGFYNLPSEPWHWSADGR